jgi:hypothetical protein
MVAQPRLVFGRRAPKEAAMPDAHDHVDVQVLEEVERLLTSTSFASIDDLASRLGGRDRDVAIAAASPRHPAARGGATGEAILVTGEPVAPLPRRR